MTCIRVALCIVTSVVVSSPALVGHTTDYPTDRVLTHREQAPLVKDWIEKRFDTVLPALMQREKIDMWIIVSREYNDDPVFRSMAPLTTYSSRRRTILAFHARGGTVDRLSIGRFDYDGLFKVVPTANDQQWNGLRKLVDERDPHVIGINTSDAWNHADGITANEKEQLLKALGPKYSARVRSAEMLAVGWLERKIPEETEAYRHVMKVAHQVIAEAFSNKVIQPGVTTSEDLVWWMRQRVANMGLGHWFHPSITIHRNGGSGSGTAPDARVIQRGDMLHTDFGLVYLGFSTDTQHNAYVLLPGEADAPAGLKAGLQAANRLQDLTMKFATVGATGNAALAAALEQARAEGLTPSIYCHPVGYHGHAAGPPIGMTDYQTGVPVRGEYVLRPDTWHSIELNVRRAVPEWGNQVVTFALEEDAGLSSNGWNWIDGRQTQFYLIK
jgi:Xaa-Pro aminopeptidase